MLGEEEHRATILFGVCSLQHPCLHICQSISFGHCYLELPLLLMFLSQLQCSLLNTLSFIFLFNMWNVTKLIFSNTVVLSLPTSPHNFYLLQMPLLCKIISRIDIAL